MENVITLNLSVDMDLDAYCEYLDSFENWTQQEMSFTVPSSRESQSLGCSQCCSHHADRNIHGSP